MEGQLIDKLSEYIERGKSVALVMVTSQLGSSPRGVGSIMIVDDQGKLLDGTIGGGKVEEQAKEDAAKCIQKNTSGSFKYDLVLAETEHSLGMACGGAVDVFVKVFSKEEDLIVFGGGHIAYELSLMAKKLNYRLTVIDTRPEYLEESRFPDAYRRILFSDFEKNPFEIPDSASVVIVTHAHSYDAEALGLVIESKARYIGMIGSRSKIGYCYDEVKKQGVDENLFEKVHSPIGLDIGGQTPAEIALAIMAEIQAVKYNRPGGFLK